MHVGTADGVWDVNAAVAVVGPAAKSLAPLPGSAGDAAARLAATRIGAHAVLVGTADSV